MPITIEYIGIQRRWPELAVTGNQSTWVPGQAEERSDAEAAALLATGLFKRPDDTLQAAEMAALKTLAAQVISAPRRSILRSALDQAFGVVTFSRTGGTSQGGFVDCYGSMRFLPSTATNVPRINGARWVFNEFTDSEGLGTGWFLGTGPTCTKTLLPMKSPNHDRPSVWRIDRPSVSNNDMLLFGSRSYRPGKWACRVEIFGDGVTQFTLRIENTSTPANGASAVVTVPAGEWRTVYVTYDIPDTTNHRVKFTVAASAIASFIMTDPQMEQIDGQPNTVPNEYVPRGVSTALLPVSAYSGNLGVGCDGGRYFDYFNPHTGSSGYLTRSTATVPIDPATMSTTVAGSDDDNQLWSSRNVGAAEWTKNGSTTVNATALDCTLLGKNSLFKIEQATGSAQHMVSQTWRAGTANVIANNRVIYASCVVRAGDAACPFVYLSIRTRDGSYKNAYIHSATGAIVSGDVSAGAVAFSFKRAGEWHFVLVTTSGNSGSNTPDLRVGVTQTSGAQTVTGTAGNGSYVGAVQSGEGLPVSYLGDTASNATLTRAAELLQAAAPDMPAVGWTISAEFATSYPSNLLYLDGWKWLAYRYVDADERGGFGIRPGAFGGFNDPRRGEPFFDFYPAVSGGGNSYWSGIHISTGNNTGVSWVANPLEFYRWRWSLATTATQANGGNHSGAVGAWVASEVGNDNPYPRASDPAALKIDKWPTLSRVFNIGRRDPSVKQRGEVFVRNLAWKPVADAAADMLTS